MNGHAIKPFNPERGLNEVLGDVAESEGNYSEAANLYRTQAKLNAQLGLSVKRLMVKAKRCDELAFLLNETI